MATGHRQRQENLSQEQFSHFRPGARHTFRRITKETLKGVHARAAEAIEKLEPFYDLLWLLHRLDILDKHREIVALGPAHVGHDALASDKTQMEERWKEAFQDSQFFPFQDVVVAAKEVRILKGGEVLRRVPHSDWEQDMGFHFDVWFDIPDAVGAKNVIDTLKEMGRVVFNIICVFKTKGHLGLAPITSPSSAAPAAISSAPHKWADLIRVSVEKVHTRHQTIPLLRYAPVIGAAKLTRFGVQCKGTGPRHTLDVFRLPGHGNEPLIGRGFGCSNRVRALVATIRLQQQHDKS